MPWRLFREIQIPLGAPGLIPGQGGFLSKRLKYLKNLERARRIERPTLTLAIKSAAYSSILTIATRRYNTHIVLELLSSAVPNSIR